MPSRAIPTWKLATGGFVFAAVLLFIIGDLAERAAPDTRERIEVRLPSNRFSGVVRITEAVGRPEYRTAPWPTRFIVEVDGRGEAEVAHLGSLLVLESDARREVECVFPDGRVLRQTTGEAENRVGMREWPFTKDPSRVYDRLEFFVGTQEQLEEAVRRVRNGGRTEGSASGAPSISNRPRPANLPGRAGSLPNVASKQVEKV